MFSDEVRQRCFVSAENPRRHIRIYINGKDVRFLGKLNTSLNDGKGVLILPAAGRLKLDDSQQRGKEHER
jgi:molybdopterin converting factor small subunit